MLKIAGISSESVVDGPGIRFTIFAQGCKHNCPECHNPATHSVDGGEEIEIDEIIEKIKANSLISGVTFSGGDPFLQAKEFTQLGKKIKELESNLDILTYTGYLFEDLVDDKEKRSLLEITDTLIDGPFIVDKKDLGLKYRGSTNQRIIDVKRSLAAGKVVKQEF